MGISIYGLTSMRGDGDKGCMWIWLTHGVVSGCLFGLVGDRYEGSRTRATKLWASMAVDMPVWLRCWYPITLCNISVPGTPSFVGEYLLLVSMHRSGGFLEVSGLLCGTTVCLVYSIRVMDRLRYGYCDRTSSQLDIGSWMPAGSCSGKHGLLPWCVLLVVHQ